MVNLATLAGRAAGDELLKEAHWVVNLVKRNPNLKLEKMSLSMLSFLKPLTSRTVTVDNLFKHDGPMETQSTLIWLKVAVETTQNHA